MAKVSALELKQRLCAIEQEALAGLGVTCDAYPRWLAKGATPPYWINRISAVRALEGVDDYGEELSLYQYSVTARLVVAHVTADYDGETSEAIDLFLPEVIETLDARELLQSEQTDVGDFSAPMRYLIRAHFVSGVGYNVFPTSIAGTAQVGAEFQFDAEFTKLLIQAYLG